MMFAPLKVAEATCVDDISTIPIDILYISILLPADAMHENKRYVLLSNLNAFIYMAVEIVGAYYLKLNHHCSLPCDRSNLVIGMRFYLIRTLRNANYPPRGIRAWS